MNVTRLESKTRVLIFENLYLLSLILAPKNIVYKKECGFEENFGSEINRCKINCGSKKILVMKTFLSKKFWAKQMKALKGILVQQNLGFAKSWVCK